MKFYDIDTSFEIKIYTHACNEYQFHGLDAKSTFM